MYYGYTPPVRLLCVDHCRTDCCRTPTRNRRSQRSASGHPVVPAQGQFAVEAHPSPGSPPPPDASCREPGPRGLFLLGSPGIILSLAFVFPVRILGVPDLNSCQDGEHHLPGITDFLFLITSSGLPR